MVEADHVFLVDVVGGAGRDPVGYRQFMPISPCVAALMSFTV